MHNNQTLDTQVKEYLAKTDIRKISGMSTTKENAQMLYDTIIKNNFTSCLEIGTNLGHGAIYMAWALSKTKGTLITIEYEKINFEQAKQYIKNAGLEQYVDLRLGDARKLVKDLDLKFDLIFADGDHDWNINYFKILASKLNSKGYIIADNVFGSWWDSAGFRTYLKNNKDFKTSYFENEDQSTIMSVSVKLT